MEHNHAVLFETVARAVPEREAIIFGDRRLTYAQVLDRSNRFARALLDRGARPPRSRRELANWESGQDHVGLYLHNGNEYLEASMGANRARTVPFNINYRYVEDELDYLLRDAKPSVVVFHSCFAPTLAAVLHRLTGEVRLIQVDDGSGEGLLPGAEEYESVLAGSSPSVGDDVVPDPDDLYMLYTGGTTGMPKGTLWRQADIYEAALKGFSVPTGLDSTSLETATLSAPAAGAVRLLAAPPFMHGAAGWAGLGSLMAAGTIVIQSEVRHFDPADVLRTVEREQVQTLLMVGDAFGRPLCEELERTSYDTGSLSVIVSGGATLSPSVKERLLGQLPNAMILDAGGASETGTQLAAFSTKGQAAALGLFQPTDTTCVVDAAKRELVRPGHAEPGWLGKRGAIPLGYLGDERKTRDTFPVVAGERLSIPGDRAVLRADGLVELLGRESMTINSGGEKIFAEEVEQALIAHPDVEDALVVGRPSERWGSEVVAVVQLTAGAGATDDELLSAAAEHISRYKLPKQIVRVPKVERSPSGKADYAWAKRQAGSL